jgi:hypothetical protein
MLDVFTEEVEVIIKDGIANLYWYKSDLHKAWLRSGVTAMIRDEIIRIKTKDGQDISKRRQMDILYEKLRSGEYNRRLEISRNFVRILVEQKNFTPQSENHRIEVAERCSLKLRELIRQQEKEREHNHNIRAASKEKMTLDSYESKCANLQLKFSKAHDFPPQRKGYALEEIFNELMIINEINVEKPFRIEGEQLDGAIKYDGHYYLLELKWTADKSDPKEIGHFLYKVEGKLQARGIFLSMNGFTNGAITTLTRGKDLKILLLDGNHLANVIYGIYKFQDLLDYSIRQASLKGIIYCTHIIQS